MANAELSKELQALIRQQKVNSPDRVSRWERIKAQTSFFAYSPETFPVYDKESGMMIRTSINDRDRWQMQEMLEKHEEKNRVAESQNIRVIFKGLYENEGD